MRDTMLRHHAGEIEISNATITQERLKAGFKETIRLFFNDYRCIFQCCRNIRVNFHSFTVGPEERTVR